MGEWTYSSTASLPGRFTPRERTPPTHWIGSWVGLRAGLDEVSLSLSGIETQPSSAKDQIFEIFFV
jgi:hypothetical protein